MSHNNSSHNRKKSVLSYQRDKIPLEAVPDEKTSPQGRRSMLYRYSPAGTPKGNSSIKKTPTRKDRDMSEYWAHSPMRGSTTPKNRSQSTIRLTTPDKIRRSNNSKVSES